MIGMILICLMTMKSYMEKPRPIFVNIRQEIKRLKRKSKIRRIFFIACVFSSTLTTLSSALNAVSALVWDDWLKKFFPQASTHFSVIMAKIIATIAGLICIGVAFLASSVGTLIEVSIGIKF